MIRNPNPDDATRAVAWRMGYAMRYRLEFSTRRPWRTLLRDTAANRKRAWRAPLSLASRELIVSSGKFDLSLCDAVCVAARGADGRGVRVGGATLHRTGHRVAPHGTPLGCFLSTRLHRPPWPCGHTRDSHAEQYDHCVARGT
jgi:hypothetical protein